MTDRLATEPPPIGILPCSSSWSSTTFGGSRVKVVLMVRSSNASTSSSLRQGGLFVRLVMASGQSDDDGKGGEQGDQHVGDIGVESSALEASG